MLTVCILDRSVYKTMADNSASFSMSIANSQFGIRLHRITELSAKVKNDDVSSTFTSQLSTTLSINCRLRDECLSFPAGAG